jgi:hypothetical protein
MQYLEKKIKKGYHYKCTDIFGVIDIISDFKIDADTLDEITMISLDGMSKGKVGKISWKLKRDNSWQKDDK